MSLFSSLSGRNLLSWLLLIGIFCFLTVGAVLMHGNERDHSNCPISLLVDCSSSSGVNSCAEFHLSMFKRAYYASVKDISGELSDLISTTIANLPIFLIILRHQRLKGYFIMRLRQINAKALGVFWIKIGEWLILYFKRDPYSLAFS